jgi:hypothetical protein
MSPEHARGDSTHGHGVPTARLRFVDGMVDGPARDDLVVAGGRHQPAPVRITGLAEAIGGVRRHSSRTESWQRWIALAITTFVSKATASSIPVRRNAPGRPSITWADANCGRSERVRGQPQRRKIWQFSVPPAVPEHCRCTPAERALFLRNPVSSTIRTAYGSLGGRLLSMFHRILARDHRPTHTAPKP